jgi:pimeloyl-ACP methyl ester carboxylesterase
MNAIDEKGYRRIGGVDQWVMIRGEDRTNPPLILLHGGPGMTETPLFRHFNAPLEQRFTVVYWDQRGAGRSYHRDLPRASMTVSQFLADLDQLVDEVRGLLRQPKVKIFGHSWGSALGVLYAARFPAKVAAYVGSGQEGDWRAGERATWAWVISELERRGDQRTLAKLRAIGPPPHDAKGLWAQRLALARLEGRLGAGELWKLSKVMLAESSLFDLPRTVRGFRFSIDCMWPEVEAIDLTTEVPELKVPVYFFLGRHDHWVSPEVSLAYFDRLRAPSKQLVWFEHSGHEPFVDEPMKFNVKMMELLG